MARPAYFLRVAGGAGWRVPTLLMLSGRDPHGLVTVLHACRRLGLAV